MSHIVISDESYSFNYGIEWIAGSGIGEEICGVDKDCIGPPSSPLLPKMEPDDDGEYVEIQMTEEEVVAEQWNTQNHGSEDVGMEFQVDTSHDEDLVVSLAEEQDEYSRLHPYPCDFCSKRFSKKSGLTAHMLSHQVSHPCNLCGSEFRRKADLVEHLKIHAYAPVKEEPEDDYEEYSELPQVKAKPRGRRKKKLTKKRPLNESVVKEKKGRRVTFSEDSYDTYEPRMVMSPEPQPEPSNGQVFPVIDPNKPYVCQHCGVGFAREKALTSHTRVHIGDSAFECEVCGDMFPSEILLRDHSLSRHGGETRRQQRPSLRREEDNEGSFLCNECGLSFPWYNQLKKHRKTHIEQETIPVDEDGHLCTLCNVVFNSLEELLYHKQDHDSELGVHTCYLCGELYETLVDLKEHLSMKHKTTNMCETCNKLFKDSKALSKHLASHHIDVRSFSCTTCARRFHSKARFKKHMLLHDASKSSNSGLLCRDCGDAFEDGQSLLNHRQSVHGINISRMFPCLQCGKAFNSRSSHQIHLRIHTGERPYGCKYCWKAFGDGGTLRKHERIHTGEKPYVCPVCSKAFNQRVVLREHIRAHHSGAESKVNENCYECMVCGAMVRTSVELCAHLVLHSDENTAKHRTPKAGGGGGGGARKYVRKKKPPQLLAPSEEDIEEEAPRASLQSVRTQRGQQLASHRAQELQALTESVSQEEELVSYSVGGETVVKIEPEEHPPPSLAADTRGRARIVRSGRRGIPKGQNKRYGKGSKSKATRLMSNTSYATKYVVSHRKEEEEGGEEEQELDEGGDEQHLSGGGELETSAPDEEETGGVGGDLTGEDMETDPLGDPGCSSGSSGDGGGLSLFGRRERPRTKNVNYHRPLKSYELATFPLEDTAPLEIPATTSRGSRGSPRKQQRNSRRGSSHTNENQYVNGIDIFDDAAAGEQIETCIVDDIDVELKLAKPGGVGEGDYLTANSEDLLHTVEYVSCDMCSEVFSNRSDLLKHIQIHI